MEGTAVSTLIYILFFLVGESDELFCFKYPSLWANATTAFSDPEVTGGELLDALDALGEGEVCAKNQPAS